MNCISFFYFFIKQYLYFFNPLSMMPLVTPVQIRLPNLPIHLIHPYIFPIWETYQDVLLRQTLKILVKGIATFSCLCVEIDLNKGFPNKIILKWRVQLIHNPCTMKTFFSTTEYVNGLIIFKMPALFSRYPHLNSKKRNRGWKNPKDTKGYKDSSSHKQENIQQQKNLITIATPLDLDEPHVEPSHPLVQDTHPSTANKRESTIILSLLMSENNFLYKLDQLDSDMKIENIIEPLTMEFSPKKQFLSLVHMFLTTLQNGLMPVREKGKKKNS